MWTLEIFVENGYFGYLCRLPVDDDFLELRSLLLFDDWSDALANGCIALRRFMR